MITTQHYGKTRCFLGNDDHNVPALTSGDRSLNQTKVKSVVFIRSDPLLPLPRDVLLRDYDGYVHGHVRFSLGNFGTMHTLCARHAYHSALEGPVCLLPGPLVSGVV